MPPLEPGEPGGAEAPPAGRAGARDVLGALPRDLLAELCQRVAQQLQAGVPAVDAPELSQRCRAAGVEIGPGHLARAARALAWVFGTAARNKLSSEELSAELGKTFSFLPKQAGQLILQVWEEERKSLIESENAKTLAAAGQLIDFQWKLGVAISADSCKSLKLPYVTVALKVADGSGSITCKTFEMTVPQFQNFYSQFKEMASVLETF